MYKIVIGRICHSFFFNSAVEFANIFKIQLTACIGYIIDHIGIKWEQAKRVNHLIPLYNVIVIYDL